MTASIDVRVPATVPEGERVQRETISPALMPPVDGARALQILAVWTRELDATERVGRVNVARQVRDALGEIGPVNNCRIDNAFEERSPIWSLLSALTAVGWGLLSGRRVPLQCALFSAASRRPELLAAGLAANVVYLDGIRTLLLLRRLRRSAPELRIVVDLDDLMSRRYQHLGRGGMPFPLGYLERLLPRVLSRLALVKGVARMVFWYEHLALLSAEKEVLELADSVVLLNGFEASSLRAVGSQIPDTLRAAVLAIRPMAEPSRPAGRRPRPAIPRTWHAIFVGSDMLVQNRLTIAHLLELWQTFGIETELRIYGRQEGQWPAVPNVTFCGYITDIADAYEPGCILVYPCLVPGGIKTKVLEAFAYGAPVIGNAFTFEDILPPNYPLVIEDQATLVGILKDPDYHAEELTCAADIGLDYIEQEHLAGSFKTRWRQAVVGQVNAPVPTRRVLTHATAVGG